MSRRKSSKRRDIEPDPKYNDVTLARFINYVMRKGKKSVAENLVYDSFDIIEKKSGQKGLEVFHKAIDNVRPVLEVSSRRVGGAPLGEDNVGEARQRAHVRRPERRFERQETGRHSQDGRGEQGVRSLQVVASPAGSSPRRTRCSIDACEART